MGPTTGRRTLVLGVLGVLVLTPLTAACGLLFGDPTPSSTTSPLPSATAVVPASATPVLSSATPEGWTATPIPAKRAADATTPAEPAKPTSAAAPTRIVAVGRPSPTMVVDAPAGAPTAGRAVPVPDSPTPSPATPAGTPPPAGTPSPRPTPTEVPPGSAVGATVTLPNGKTIKVTTLRQWQSVPYWGKQYAREPGLTLKNGLSVPFDTMRSFEVTNVATPTPTTVPGTPSFGDSTTVTLKIVALNGISVTDDLVQQPSTVYIEGPAEVGVFTLPVSQVERVDFDRP